MTVLVVFLLGTMALSGTRAGARLLRRPIVLVAIAVIVAASYYSLRIVE